MAKLKDNVTVDDMIKEIRTNAEKEIQALINSQTWDKRFKSAFNGWVKHHTHELSCLDGHTSESHIDRSINEALKSVNLSVAFKAATFENDLYKQSEINSLVNDYNLSEYPIYTVYTVFENTEVVGYIQINCNYSSYNGNEYSGWSFVKAKEITCTVFIKYQS